MSLSAGPPGATFTTGSSGTFFNVGAPGTGLSHRQRISGGSTRRSSGAGSRQQREAESVAALLAREPSVRVPLDGGVVTLIDGKGVPFLPEEAELLWRRLKDEIVRMVSTRCEAVRQGIDALAALHTKTPAPQPISRFSPTPFTATEPAPPLPVRYHWLWRAFPPHRRRIDRENLERADDFQRAHAAWVSARDAHAAEQRVAMERFGDRDSGDPDRLERFLDWALSHLDWPQDTAVDLKVDGAGRRLLFDVDLPEIEDLPVGAPEFVLRSREVRVRPLTETARRKLYAAHVHGVLFRLAGEGFHHCPLVEEIVVSGYSQRRDRTTGRIADEYLLSAHIRRGQWETIDFAGIDHLDPVDALARFQLVRRMSKTGVFAPITPLA